MPALAPSNPSECMVIRNVNSAVTTLSLPFNRFGRLKVGGRGTIVRLRSGALAVFSPVALTPEVKSRVRELGEVKYITALDMEHHIFVGPWHKEYPSAAVMGPAGLEEKRRKQSGVEEVKFTHEFQPGRAGGKGLESVDQGGDFDQEFEWEYVSAHANKELVFCHKPSRTLIEADLLFNLPAHEQYSRYHEPATKGPLTRLMNAICHTRGDAVWQKRFVWYGVGAADRQGFARSVARIDAWDFDTIVPCHGDVLERDAHPIFAKIMQWHLDLAKQKHL